MTRLLAEQPGLLAILLIAVAMACFYGWLQTGKRPAAICGAIALALIPLGFLIAEKWDTDREQIERLLDQTAAAVEANDVAGVVAVIHPEKEEIRRRAEAEMPRYEFSKASVGQIRSIEFIVNALPPEALVDITANVVVSVKSASVTEQRVSRRIKFRFQKWEDRWYVTDYTHLPVIGGPDAFSPPSDLLGI